MSLVELCQDDSELYRYAFQALKEGRQQNEREADAFGAQVLAALQMDFEPVLEFLKAMPGDLQHPPGTQRAELVKKALSS
jgi:hypothetical protein